MNNLKLCVYAICKNESKFVNQWVSGIINEADQIVVLDTGSTDNTVELLKQYPKIKVVSYDYSKDGIFRFDKARNDSMKLIPFDADICVVLDFDHIPRPGWSNIIKEEFSRGNTEVYGYIINHTDDDDSDLDRWTSKNVHANDPHYIWNRMIHEELKYIGSKEPNGVFRDDFVIDHYPDNSKDRSGYRVLLEKAIDTYPKDPYYAIFYGVELARRYSNLEAYQAFKEGLERCDFSKQKQLHYQMLLNISGLCKNDIEALEYLDKAVLLNFESRRIYKMYADRFENIGDYNGAIESLEKALEINNYKNDWTDDFAYYNGYIEDRLSLLYYYRKDDLLKAIKYEAEALAFNPNNKRMINNLKYYYEKFMQGKKEN